MNGHSEDAAVRQGLEVAVRIGVVVLLTAGCLVVLSPFAAIIGWAIVIAVALDPTYEQMCTRLGGRRKTAALIVTLALLGVLIAPAVALSETLFAGVTTLARGAEAGTLRIPPPSPSVASWPVIGERLSAAWSLAATNLDQLLAANQQQIVEIVRWMVAQVTALGLSFLQIIVAIVASAFLLTGAQAAGDSAARFVRRIAGPEGARLSALAVATTRSVARGVLGVALIQAIMTGIGLLAAGVPGAGLLAMLALITCVVQLGPALVVVPAAIYLFATASTLTAVLFTAWGVLVLLVDNFLKPILLGRGVDVPMIVVVLGAIGGLLAMGVFGLFGGAIVLVLGYATLKAWLSESQEAAP
jgi:predicted PurR-regulated permease PerM